jgi:hypothetical protein
MYSCGLALLRLLFDDIVCPFRRFSSGFQNGLDIVDPSRLHKMSHTPGPGMRWSRLGAHRMLAFRSAILSVRFDQTWAALQNSPAS